MKRILYYTVLVAGVLASSCGSDHKNDPEEVDTKDVKRVTVVYAVNRNNLSSDFIDDSREMLAGLSDVDATTERLLCYWTSTKTEAGLYEAQRKSDKWEWVKVKSYERNVTSTDPERLRTVLTDAVSRYPDADRTLMFWGHGSAWTPSFTDSSVRSRIAPEAGDGNLCYGYGGELDDNGVSKYMEIDELAASIPDGSFDTIWFDCCYMASIEVVYQLRNKCRWFVAYPTEVYGEGLNYNQVLPYIMQEQPKLVEAADIFYSYFDMRMEPVTVSVMDMDRVEPVADAVKDIIRKYGDVGSASGVVNYSRDKNAYYDLSQLMKRRSDGDEAAVAQLDKALKDMIIYHAEFDVDFNKRPWIDTPLSGISMCNFKNENDARDKFYRTLDWYGRVY